MNGALRIPRRVRHDLKFRALEVVSVEDLTPGLRRIVLGGDDLEGFISLGFDDHVKLFPPKPGKPLVLPTVGPDGPVFPEPRPAARDYTPRSYDAAARRLTIDFVTGHGGPATEWAMTAAPGSVVGVGGPRGSFIVPTAFQNHLLIGDDTALPAIARRLEELPQGVSALAVIEVDDAASILPLASPADLTLIWVERNGRPRAQSDALTQAFASAAADIDPSDAYVWIAAESLVAKALRTQAVSLGFNAKTMKAAGYWRKGAVGAHEVIED